MMTSLRNRILIFFTLFGVAAFLSIYMSGRSTEVVGKAAWSVTRQHLPMVRALGEMESALLRQDLAGLKFLDTGAQDWRDEFEKNRIGFSRWYIEAENGATVQSEKDHLAEIDEVYIQYDNQLRQLILGRNRFSKAYLNKKLAQNAEWLNVIMSNIDQIEAVREGMTFVRQEQIENTLRRHRRFAYYFLAVVTILFGALAFYLWYFLARPLSLLQKGIRNFTRGRLDVQIPPVGKDELGELQDAFNEMAREISVERKRLKTESQSDPLTGLFNMRYFRLQLAEEFSRSQRYAHQLALLMIDVDHFKEYNDKNGHPSGDIVLKEISRILIRNVRGTDIVARYGGEEFVILLPETNSESARKVAEKIRRSVEVHHFPFQDESSEKLTVSVGIAAYPDVHVTSDQDLVEASDQALYIAKKEGRNRVCLSQPEPHAKEKDKPSFKMVK